MAQKQTRQHEYQRLQLLAQYRAWHDTFMHEHAAAIARERLLRLRGREISWHWLPL